MKNIILIVIFLGVVTSCQKEKLRTSQEVKEKQFTKISSEKSNIKFKNSVTENLYFNFLNYPYVYNGGGVAAGDINNDGLVDLYFSSNQHSNKLYLNKGDFKFDDITNAANVVDELGWTTGVTMIDINNDGWLDIYVCKAGSLEAHNPRKNKLFINQKDNTFKESAKEYGLDFYGFSVQAHFFDMDNDSDLDMYLVGHRVDFRNNVTIDLERDKIIEDYGSDQLFRNDNGKFTNITDVSGITNKAWGLSASIGDFNNDGWMDVFVANDFFHGDYLYINNQDGTFTDEILTRFNHISNNSMGSDFADINNDLHPDLMVLDMMAEDHIRGKKNMASMNTNSFNMMVNSGYHHQYMTNVLQLNNGNGSYSEISYLAGIAKTDWSWAPLIADFDNDGFKDVFITNGIKKDLSNQDFRDQMRQNIMHRKKVSIEEAIGMMPSEKLQNYIYKNNGDLTFSNSSNEWGITEKINSNGAAYADLDNDGDLDLIINNMEDKAGIYKNNSSKNYIQIKLKGPNNNKLAIGTKVIIQLENQKQMQEVYLSRGFQSSVNSKLTFGIDNSKSIKKIQVYWPNKKLSELINIASNQLIEIAYNNAKPQTDSKNELKIKPFFEKVEATTLGIDFKHQENEFDDFRKQILLPHSQSKNGPFIDASDVNNDGLQDFFIGGAKGQAGELYLQKESGKFQKQISDVFYKDKAYEDLGVLFLDVDNDADQDLYVVSGGAEFSANNVMYQDRLYINDGAGNFKKSNDALPKMNTSGQVVISNDVDNDGDLDLFVGGRVIPDKYPFAPKSYLLINEKGIFKSKIMVDDFTYMGLITDAIFTDYDNDGDQDLFAVGEWTKIQVFENTNGDFIKKEVPDLEKTAGLWFSLEEKDMDNDGDMDYFIGNLGLNSKFKAKPNKSFQIFCDDFDKNGTYDIILTNEYKGELVPLRGKECTSQQMPSINEKFKTFNDFAKADMTSIFGEQNLKEALHLSADIFYSVYLENLGNSKFNIVKLPNSLQIAPILDFEFIDVNKDGIDEIISVGNFYHTEVETVRFDASYGNVMRFYNNQFELFPYQQTNFSILGDAKNIKIISQPNNQSYLLILNNNQEIQVFKQDN